MTDIMQMVKEGGSIVVLAVVLWLGFKLFEKASNRSQEREDRSQAYIQKRLDRESEQQAQTLIAMQSLSAQAVESNVQVAQAMQAVQQSMTEHRKEAAEAAAQVSAQGQKTVQALERLCVKIGE